MNREILNKAGGFITRVVFGPEIEGTVVRRKLDKNYSVVHVLLDTETGGLEHIIKPTSSGFYLQPGRYLQIRARSKRWWSLPWRRIEKDPFGLESKRPKTPLPDSIKRILDSANIKAL